MEVVLVLLIAIAAGAAGLWLGMLAAPRIGRVVERDEDAEAEAEGSDDGQ